MVTSVCLSAFLGDDLCQSKVSPENKGEMLQNTSFRDAGGEPWFSPPVLNDPEVRISERVLAVTL